MLAERQVAATLLAAGNKYPLPDLEERRQALDAALCHDPTVVDEDDELLQALGVR